MVSIAAFQAVDPGSIPGHRMTFYFHLGLEHLILTNPETDQFFICQRYVSQQNVFKDVQRKSMQQTLLQKQ